MSFAAPLAGLIALATLVPAFIAVYILKLRRSTVRVSSTLLWASTVRESQGNVPFRSLRATAVFFLQLLALLLLIAAIAQPTMQAPRPIAPRVIIVLDTSASMNAPADAASITQPNQPAPTRFARATEQVLDLLVRLESRSPRPQVTLIACASTPTQLTSPTTVYADVRTVLANLAPTHTPADLAAALDLASAVASTASIDPRNPESDAAAPDASLFIFSDAACTPPTVNALPSIADAQLISPLDPASPPPANRGITTLSASRTATDPATIRVFYRVLASTDAAATQPASITAALNDQPITAQPLTFTESPLGPSAEGVLTLNAPTRALLTLALSTSDSFPLDDRAYAVVVPPPAPAVLIVTPDDATLDPFIAHYLRVADLRAHQTMTLSTYRRTLDTDPADIPARFDTIIYATPYARIQTPIPLPSLFIASVPDHPSLRIEAATDARRARVTTWPTTDPLLEHLSLSSITTRSPASLVADSASDNTLTQLTPLVRTTASTPLVARFTLNDQQHILLPYPLTDTNWGADISFPIFLARAIESLAFPGSSAPLRFITTGSSTTIRPATPDQPITLTPPDPLSPVTLASPHASSLSVSQFPRTGLYTLTNTAPADAVIAANLLSQPDTLLRPDDLTIASRPLTPSTLSQTAPRPLWPIALAIALALLAAEWFLSLIRS